MASSKSARATRYGHFTAISIDIARCCCCAEEQFSGWGKPCRGCGVAAFQQESIPYLHKGLTTRRTKPCTELALKAKRTNARGPHFRRYQISRRSESGRRI